MAERLPCLPLSFLGVLMAVNYKSSSSNEQAKGHIGRRIGQDTRSIAYRDATGRGGGDIDVIETDGIVAHDFQARRSIQQRGVDAIGEQSNKALAGRDFCQQ